MRAGPQPRAVFAERSPSPMPRPSARGPRGRPRWRPRRARSGRRAGVAATAGRRPSSTAASAAPRPSAEPARLSFLAPELPPPVSRNAAPAPDAPSEPFRPVPPPAQLRREQARLRRAALIADQLGDRDLPLYLVDFMVVEDASVELGFERAVETVARREGREPDGARGRLAPRRRADRARRVDPLRRRAAALRREDRRRPHRGRGLTAEGERAPPWDPHIVTRGARAGKAGPLSETAALRAAAERGRCHLRASRFRAKPGNLTSGGYSLS